MGTRGIAAVVLGVALATTVCAEELSVTKVRLRRNSSGQGDNSVLRMQGFFVTNPPTDVFDAANGVAIRVQDAITTDVTVTFLASECTTVSGKTRCYGGGKKYISLVAKPLRGIPSAFSVVVKVRALNLVGPFDGPVTVTVTETNSGIDRVGTISDCVLKITGIACRAF
ncbi:MAG TPA: hypothetical protein VMS22_18995 [Candidatus Eisenbacteria bacterium]|nr:hypothetical protein [Candidatus Eisenbacteria bacterium]